MKNVYRRIAIWLSLCLLIGLTPSAGVPRAASGIKAKLVIVNTYVTGKTYKLKKGKHRQLSVETSNTFGRRTVTYQSSKPKVAKITKKGYITALKKGTTKITVKVTCKKGKKKRTKRVWVKIKVTDTSSSSVTSSPQATATASVGGALQALVIVNGTDPKQFPMTILDNASGRQFYDSLPKVLYMTDQNKNVKTAIDTETIYTMDEYKPGTLRAGDFMLYGTSRYELTYADHDSGYMYTRLGRLSDTSGLEKAMGTGPVSVTIIRSTLPTPSPTPTVAPTKTPSASPTGSPSATPSGSPSATATPSGSPAATATPSGSPTASASPGASASPSSSATPTASTKPTASAKPTATPTTAPTSPPVYSGPRIRIESNGFDYLVQVNESSAAAMAFYQSLSTTVPLQLYMIPTIPSKDRYYARLATTLTQDGEKVESRWPAGSLVLTNNDTLNIFRVTTQNMSGDLSTLLGTIDTTSIPVDTVGTGFLKSMLNGEETQLVCFYKV